MIYQILDSYNCDIALNRKILVAPKLIFFPSIVRDCSPAGFGFWLSEAEQKAVIKKRKSPTWNEGAAVVKGNALLLLNREPNAAFVVWAVFTN